MTLKFWLLCNGSTPTEMSDSAFFPLFSIDTFKVSKKTQQNFIQMNPSPIKDKGEKLGGDILIFSFNFWGVV